MTLADAKQILEKCVEIQKLHENTAPSWMKIGLSLSVSRDAVEYVYNDLIKPFGMDKVFAAGEIVYYKGVRLIVS